MFIYVAWIFHGFKRLAEAELAFLRHQLIAPVYRAHCTCRVSAFTHSQILSDISSSFQLFSAFYTLATG